MLLNLYGDPSQVTFRIFCLKTDPHFERKMSNAFTVKVSYTNDCDVISLM